MAGGCIPPETIGALAGEGVAYGIVDASCTRSGQATATPGAYRVKNADLVVLVANAPAGRALAGGKTDAIARIAFERRLAGLSSPVVMRADVGPGALTVPELRAAVDSLTAQGWMRTALGREVAGRRIRKTVTLRTGRGATQAPVDYWDDVRAGRDWAKALTAGFGADKPAAVTAQRDSLIAECSAWAGPAGDWALADRGRAFANNATRLGKAVLGGVSLTVKPVTLAGTSGKVPVIISNEAKTPLTLRVTAVPSREVELAGKRSSVMEVMPKDNFIEVPVELRDSLSGRLTVAVSAGGLVLASDSVTVRASYLDRLVMILGVVLVLGVLLAFIIKRVRDAETAGTNTSEDGNPGTRDQGGE